MTTVPPPTDVLTHLLDRLAIKAIWPVLIDPRTLDEVRGIDAAIDAAERSALAAGVPLREIWAAIDARVDAQASLAGWTTAERLQAASALRVLFLALLGLHCGRRHAAALRVVQDRVSAALDGEFFVRTTPLEPSEDQVARMQASIEIDDASQALAELVYPDATTDAVRKERRQAVGCALSSVTSGAGYRVLADRLGTSIDEAHNFALQVIRAVKFICDCIPELNEEEGNEDD